MRHSALTRLSSKWSCLFHIGCQFAWGISSIIGKGGQLQGEGHQLMWSQFTSSQSTLSPWLVHGERVVGRLPHMRGPGLMQEYRADGCLTQSRCSVASASLSTQFMCHTEVPAMCVMLELKETWGAFWQHVHHCPVRKEPIYHLCIFLPNGILKSQDVFVVAVWNPTS